VRLFRQLVGIAERELVTAVERGVPRAEPQVREDLGVDVDILGAHRADRLVLRATGPGKRDRAGEGDRGYRCYPSDARGRQCLDYCPHVSSPSSG
jgi:hypothetical protein